MGQQPRSREKKRHGPGSTRGKLQRHGAFVERYSTIKAAAGHRPSATAAIENDAKWRMGSPTVDLRTRPRDPRSTTLTIEKKEL